MFLQGSVEHCMIGVQILSQLTCEMNQPEVDINVSHIKHRKTVYSFRDTQLYDIYILACTLLMTARDNCKTLNFMDEKQHGYVSIERVFAIAFGKFNMYFRCGFSFFFYIFFFNEISI